MGLLKPRKNKKFDYKPRFYVSDRENESGNPFKIEQKFDKFRKSGSGGLKSKFVNAFDELKEPQDKNSKKTILIIIAILILVFLFIIDFDLSIFSIKK